MPQNQATLKRAKFATFKTNYQISFTWKSNLGFDLLVKKRKIADRPSNKVLVFFQTGVHFLGHPVR